MVKCLEEEGVTRIFGYPGVAISPFYEALYNAGTIEHVLVRQEQAAGHAASGYARISRKAAVCVTSSGPGATNLITALATAYADSIPLIAITGQVNSNLLGRDVLQEADMRGSTESFVKYRDLIGQCLYLWDFLVHFRDPLILLALVLKLSLIVDTHDRVVLGITECHPHCLLLSCIFYEVPFRELIPPYTITLTVHASMCGPAGRYFLFFMSSQT